MPTDNKKSASDCLVVSVWNSLGREVIQERGIFSAIKKYVLGLLHTVPKKQPPALLP